MIVIKLNYIVSIASKVTSLVIAKPDCAKDELIVSQENDEKKMLNDSQVSLQES